MRQATQPESASKTILVVDDEPQILNSVAGFLRSQYRVLSAKSGPDALRQSEEFKGEIHVLLSDFQMAEMTGVELATRISAARPDIKVLLMSGYAEGMLALSEGWHFLAKPFVLSQLRSLVGDMVRPSHALVGTLRSAGKVQLAHGLK